MYIQHHNTHYDTVTHITDDNKTHTMTLWHMLWQQDTCYDWYILWHHDDTLWHIMTTRHTLWDMLGHIIWHWHTLWH